MSRLPAPALFAILLGTLLVPYTAARAQSPDSTALPAVVITATRVDVPVARDVSAVTVLRGDELRRDGVRDLADALRMVPGVSVVQSGGAGSQASLFLRGGESDYVRVLVDGVAVNDPGGAIDLSAVGIDDIDRIEIVRGPSSVLYGTDAVSGVVQVFTRASDGRDAAAAMVEAGSQSSRRWDVSLGAGSRAANAMLGAEHLTTDGILPFNNAYRADAVSGLARYAGATGTHATLTVRHREDAYHYPTDGAGAIVDHNAMRAERRSVAALDLSQALAPRARLAVTLATMDVHGHTDDAQDTPGDTLGLYAYRSAGAMRRRLADAHVQAGLTGGAIATVGVEWMRESQSSVDSSNYDVGLNRFSAVRSNRAAYAQVAGDHGAVSWTLGGRYDESGGYGIFRTARGGFAARPWQGGVLRATLGTAFKAPTFLETEPTAFSNGNGALRPERSRSWEVGASQAIGAWDASVSATWFDQRFRDLVQYAFQGPGLPDYFNVAAASARGLELELRASPHRGLRASGSLTLLDTRVEDAGLQSGPGDTFVQGGRLLRRPATNASVTLSASPSARLALDVTVLRVGRREDRDFSTYPATPVTLGAYQRVDLAGTFRLAGGNAPGGAMLRFRVDNLLAARYQEIANFAAPGRVLSLGMSVGAGSRPE